MKQTEKRDVHVVLASDNYYYPYIYVAVRTLFDSNKSIETLIVHYIEQDVKRENLILLKELGQSYNREVDIIPFKMPKEFFEVLPAFGKASKTTYAKFWFSTMFPNEDRVLYLDPDVLVLRSISEMYNIDFDGNLIAGVIENLPTYHMEASHMKDSDSYINGGMVLCNLAAWRDHHFEEQALERLKDTSHNLNYDQGILNEICRGKILVLPPKYNTLAEVFEFKRADRIKKRYGFKNYYTQKEIDEAITVPVIIHFTGFLYGKPMSTKCTHPWAMHFQSILSNSPVKYQFTNRDISIKKKVRKLVLHYTPFSIYLLFENLLDIRRKKVL